MEKLDRFKTQDLTDKMKTMYLEFIQDATALHIENRSLSAKLESAMRKKRIIERLLVVSVSANAIILSVLL